MDDHDIINGTCVMAELIRTARPVSETADVSLHFHPRSSHERVRRQLRLIPAQLMNELDGNPANHIRTPSNNRQAARSKIKRKRGRLTSSTTTRTASSRPVHRPRDDAVVHEAAVKPSEHISTVFDANPSSEPSFAGSDLGVEWNFDPPSDLGQDTSGDGTSQRPLPFTNHTPCGQGSDHFMPAAKRVRVSAFDQWTPHRQSYLDELLALDGIFHSSADSACFQCEEAFASDVRRYRCLDCFGIPHYCEDCVRRQHKCLPFHHIEHWNDKFWESRTLDRLQLILQLGHGGEQCILPGRSETLTVLHVDGFHRVNVTFCGCSSDEAALLERNQLLRVRLFPASPETPKTAFTFVMLDMLCHLSTQGKLTTYDFYYSLLHLTDNAGVKNWHKRYDELGHAIRWHKHLLMLKRAGRGHDASGIENTQQGELVVECPACPHPGKNLADGWEREYEANPHLYTTFRAMDANRRLLQRDKGFNSSGSLGPGWSYYVEPRSFERELKRVEASQQHAQSETTCDSTFAAIERANLKAAKGFAVTGVVACIDSRHGFLLPNAIGDLQKGERYVNSDYVFLSSMHDNLPQVNLSYDIACQYSVNFYKRASAFAPTVKKRFDQKKISFGVPKFHLPAHGPDCWTKFSLNFLSGWARVDGEEIERTWSGSNSVAASTRQMAPGTRHDFLDDLWGAVNFRKMCNLGKSLYSKLKTASKELKRRSAELAEMTAAVDEATIAEWQGMIDLWQTDPFRHPDPYQELTPEYALRDIKAELALEEGHQLSIGGMDFTHILSESQFLIQGLELEEAQRKLLVEIGAEGKSTTKKLSQALTIKRATLQRRIMRWTEIQGAYMPDVVLYRQRARETTVPIPQDIAIILLNHTSTTAQELDDSSSEQGDDSADEVAGSSGPTRVGIEAETFDLLLPSSETVIYNRLASQSLHDKEIRLRHAHLDTYLQELRRLLRIKSSAYVDKRKNVSGQKGGTRANSDIQKFNLKINCTVSSYQFTRGVLLRLDPSGPWQERLKPLLKADVRAPEQDDSDDEPDGGSHTQSLVHRIRRRVRAESKRQISWIWRIPRLADGPDEAGNEDTIGSGVRVQWAKAQARAQRYAEEHGLLQDEMRRVCAYFEWKASWWRDRRRVGRVDASQRVKAGLDSYAEKQAAMLESLRAQFIGLWRPLLTDLGLPSSWMDQYSAQKATL